MKGKVMKRIKTTWNADDNCHDCGQSIVWGKPMSTGNGSVTEEFEIDNVKVIGNSYEGGHTYALKKNGNVFATVCRACIVHFEMMKDKRIN